jgi:hypothetical protein
MYTDMLNSIKNKIYGAGVLGFIGQAYGYPNPYMAPEDFAISIHAYDFEYFIGDSVYDNSINSFKPDSTLETRVMDGDFVDSAYIPNVFMRDGNKILFTQSFANYLGDGAESVIKAYMQLFSISDLADFFYFDDKDDLVTCSGLFNETERGCPHGDIVSIGGSWVDVDKLSERIQAMYINNGKSNTTCPECDRNTFVSNAEMFGLSEEDMCAKYDAKNKPHHYFDYGLSSDSKYFLRNVIYGFLQEEQKDLSVLDVVN